MSKAAQQARQIVIEELDQIERETLELWRNHVNSIKLKGGPGSGNFRHSGRPGKVGGSAPGKFAGWSKADFEQAGYIPIFRGTGAAGVVQLRASEEGVYGPGVYWYDNPKDARSYAEPGGGIVTAYVHQNDANVYAGGETVSFGLRRKQPDVIVTQPDNVVRRGVIPTERTTSDFDMYEEASKALDQSTYKEVQSITIDPEIKTEEHLSLLKDDAIELRTASMSSSQREKLQDKYNWLLANEDDAKRLQGIRDKGTVAPPILGGTEEDWWVVDGMHRIAILANDGVVNFPAYFMTGIRNIKQLPIDEQSKQVLLDLRIELLKDELDALSEQVFSGEISIGQFQEDFKALIKGGRTSAAAIGKGGWDQMNAQSWGRLGTPMREQYKYLRGFVDLIAENKDTISLKYIKNRARMYADAIVQDAILMETPLYIADLLPTLPKAGDTQCLVRCHCRWELSISSKDDKWQTVEAFWMLGDADHCEDCVDNTKKYAPFVMRVPLDVEVPKIIGGY